MHFTLKLQIPSPSSNSVVSFNSLKNLHSQLHQSNLLSKHARLTQSSFPISEKSFTFCKEEIEEFKIAESDDEMPKFFDFCEKNFENQQKLFQENELAERSEGNELTQKANLLENQFFDQEEKEFISSKNHVIHENSFEVLEQTESDMKKVKIYLF